MDGLVSQDRLDELYAFILKAENPEKITFITETGGLRTTDHVYAHCTVYVPSVHPNNFSSHLIVGRRVDMSGDDEFVRHSNVYNQVNLGEGYEACYRNHSRLRDTYLAIELHNALGHPSTPIPTSNETPLLILVCQHSIGLIPVMI